MATTGHPEKTRGEILRGFYIHLACYVIVNIGLCALNFTRNPDNLWFYWVAGGWGIGIACHALGVFGNSSKGRLEN